MKQAHGSGSLGLVQIRPGSSQLLNGSTGVSALTIDASSNVGIGTAGPAHDLHVQGAAGTVASLVVYGDDTQQQGLNVGTSDTDRWAFVHGTDNSLLVFEDHSGDGGTAATRLAIAAGGAIYASAGLTAATTGQYLCINTSTYAITRGASCSASDVRLKTDIQPLERSLDVISALKPVSFKWKDEESWQRA